MEKQRQNFAENPINGKGTTNEAWHEGPPLMQQKRPGCDRPQTHTILIVSGSVVMGQQPIAEGVHEDPVSTSMWLMLLMRGGFPR
eukprot:5681121-Karenia_brevis.AAC.1